MQFRGDTDQPITEVFLGYTGEAGDANLSSKYLDSVSRAEGETEN